MASSYPMESKRSSRSYTGSGSMPIASSSSHASSSSYVDVFESTQSRTFLKWLNTRLEPANIPAMRNLGTDLSDGVRLCQLMEIMSQTSLGRYNLNPRMRVQKAENVNKALQFIKGSGVVLTNIGPEDIIDGNLKLILGMIWTLILRFTIADINEEGLSAKEGLLLWCQRKTQPYSEVDVQDFSRSWKDGLAFCALIHRHRPDLLDWDKLDKSDPRVCTRLAFTIAQQHLNIPQLLDVADICDTEKPDDRSVMTYVAQYFHAFSVMDRADTLARRVTMFADTLETIWQSRHDYERRVTEFIAAIRALLTQWETSELSSTYPEAKRESAEFIEYKKTLKREWVGQKADLAGLLGNISTKLRTYDMKPYVPPEGCRQADLDACWQDLLAGEAARSRGINANIRRIKEALRRRFADLANGCEQALQRVSLDLAADALAADDAEHQLAAVTRLHERVSRIASETLPQILRAEQDCESANVEESDFTVYTFEDLEFETRLVRDAVAKKKAFIENQIVARSTTKLTPAQLEEFESTFRHFDKDQTNTLGVAEFSAALSALGIIYSDDDTFAIHSQLSGQVEEGRVDFQAWIDFLTDITEDQTTPDQVRESFAGIAQGKPYVTELDLKLAFVPQQTINFLKTAMPPSSNGAADSGARAGEGETGSVMDFDRFLDDAFSQ